MAVIASDDFSAGLSLKDIGKEHSPDLPASISKGSVWTRLRLKSTPLDQSLSLN